jgi:hypothetical protein
MLSLEGLISLVVWTSFFDGQEKVFHFWKKYTFFIAVIFFQFLAALRIRVFSPDLGSKNGNKREG